MEAATRELYDGDVDDSDDVLAIREGVRRVCSKFPDAYWRERDSRHEFPWDFYAALAEGAGSASRSRRSTAVVAAGSRRRRSCSRRSRRRVPR
jgi:hypothetical protein